MLITIIAVAVLIAMIIATSGDNRLSMPESIVGSAVTPVADAASGATNGVADFFARVFRTTDTDRELAAAQERIAALEGSLSTMDELQKENARFKELLDFKDSMPEVEMAAARVTGKNPGVWFDMFTINAGRAQNIEAGMPVLTGDGLVGYVLEVGALWSKVVAIVDRACSVPAIVERTRDDVMIRGMLSTGEESALCQMYNLRFENDLVPGDRVLTSGLGGGFPKGIMIGEIIEVNRVKDETNSNATIRPAVDFAQIEEVLIITSLTGVAEEEE